MGSPGLFVDKAEDFSRPDIDYFTMAAPGDYVTWLERFGANPNEPDSGFTRLDSGGMGHSQYLADGSISQRNAIAIIADDDAHLDRRGRNMVERLFAPVDVLRDWVDAPNRALDDAQRDLRIPYVGHAVDRGIDLVQSASAAPIHVVDRGAEAVQDGTGVVSSVIGWTKARLKHDVLDAKPVQPEPGPSFSGGSAW